MKTKIGVDLVDSQRVAKLWQNSGAAFIQRFLSAQEQTFFAKHEKLEYLASRWAAKEALYKSYQGEKDWAWICKFSVLNSANGAPYLKHPELESCEHIQISLSHEKTMAIAFVQRNI